MDELNKKKCTRCGEEKPQTEEFFKLDGRFLRTGKIIFCDICLECRAKSGALNSKRYRAKKVAEDKEAYYSNRNKQAAQYREANREYIALRQNQYYKRNKDKINEQRRKRPKEVKRQEEINFYDRHPFKLKAKRVNRKARIRGAIGKIKDSDIIDKLNNQSNSCCYCGTELYKDFHVDHIIPISKGGYNISDNICCSCPECNLEKNDKTGTEYMEFLERRINGTVC